ncbi:his Kinase A domain protein, partial [Vibrio parahaemolyticus V-223/04]
HRVFRARLRHRHR